MVRRNCLINTTLRQFVSKFLCLVFMFMFLFLCFYSQVPAVRPRSAELQAHQVQKPRGEASRARHASLGSLANRQRHRSNNANTICGSWTRTSFPGLATLGAGTYDGRGASQSWRLQSFCCTGDACCICDECAYNAVYTGGESHR